MLQTFAVFLLGLTFLHPISIYADENSNTSEDQSTQTTEDSAKNKQLKAAVKMNAGSSNIPANVQYSVTATLTALEDAPSVADEKKTLTFTGTGENSFDALPFDRPGTYRYRLDYTLQTNSNRVSIHHGKSYLITVEVFNSNTANEDGTLGYDWYYFVSPITDDANTGGESVEPVKVGDSAAYLQYNRPSSPTTPDDPDDPDEPDNPNNPSFPNLPDTNNPNKPGDNNTNISNTNNPSLNLPNTNNPGTTGTTSNTTTTSSTKPSGGLNLPNTATETSLMTYLFWMFVSGSLILLFVFLARRKAQQD